MKATIEKVIYKEKHYKKYISSTVYIFNDKSFYNGIRDLKKILQSRGYTEFEIIDRGVCKMNY
jgi:hypothetical protein